MRLTTKGRYAVMAMADLASYSKNKPVSLSEISKRQNISLAYLEQLFIHLKEDKLVRSIRGVQGGYALVMLAQNKLIGVRDPIGIRPLVIGKLKNSYVLASEK